MTWILWLLEIELDLPTIPNDRSIFAFLHPVSQRLYQGVRIPNEKKRVACHAFYTHVFIFLI